MVYLLPKNLATAAERGHELLTGGVRTFYTKQPTNESDLISVFFYLYSTFFPQVRAGR